jgi:hypothetical protein
MLLASLDQETFPAASNCPDVRPDPLPARNDLLHLFKEQLAPRLLPLACLLRIAETHLAHRLAPSPADASMKSHFG